MSIDTIQQANGIPSHDQQQQQQPQEHAPSVSSPLNPDPSTTSKSKLSSKPPAREREQREKKDSFKKREAAGQSQGIALASSSSTVPAKRKGSDTDSKLPGPKRLSLPEPKRSDFEASREIAFASHEPAPIFVENGAVELVRPIDVIENKNHYRYEHCIADPEFRHKQYFRRSDLRPFGPCMPWQDADKWIYFDKSAHYVTNEQGWRMARANVCAREGTFYYEVKIVKASTGHEAERYENDEGPKPHIRMGWARREAPLDAPVGFDAASYGVTDIRFQTMHRSRPGKFFQAKTKQKTKSSSSKEKDKAPPRADSTTKKAAAAPDENITDQLEVQEGDVIGLEIQLPSLRLHRKVVSGVYNPAVDLINGTETPEPSVPEHSSTSDPPADIIRDRIPVSYKNKGYFEIVDYAATKPLEAYNDRTLSASALNSGSGPSGPTPSGSTIIKHPPNPNHPDPSLRTLPTSAIRVYKNGEPVGTAFENLLAFLPPASAPSQTALGITQGFDDGMVGYFPAVACFSGGVAQVNFGTEEVEVQPGSGRSRKGFWFPPRHLVQENDGSVGSDTIKDQSPADAITMPTRPIGVRYKEQIAEDVVWDLVDEVDFFMQDGGFAGEPELGADLMDRQSVDQRDPAGNDSNGSGVASLREDSVAA